MWSYVLRLWMNNATPKIPTRIPVIISMYAIDSFVLLHSKNRIIANPANMSAKHVLT